MRIYTIGFTQKSAAQFFETLKRAGIKQLLDVRLHNSSQLAGFSKRDDLAYFLKEICQAKYKHEPMLAPDTQMLDLYKKKKIKWSEYESLFLDLLADRKIERELPPDLFAKPTVLLCSEAGAQQCHRRLVLEYLSRSMEGIEIVHL